IPVHSLTVNQLQQIESVSSKGAQVQENGAQCYGALGGTVSLQLMDDFSGIHRYQVKAKNVTVLSGGKKQQPVIMRKDRSSFLPSNGTFWIHNLSRNDSGEYRLQTFDSNGKLTENRTLQLLVQGKCFYQVIFEVIYKNI
uniref:Immunoglobulin V-set domain-containing protein n=1 Tax=Oryzias latipes TaxID=8090 RepID=A0A3B3IGU0_ORYLA